MAALAVNLTSVANPFNRTLSFARQPEPDLEFTEEELDQTIATRTRGPVNPHKKSGGGSPILWILLLALVGGVAYVSMEPEIMTEWLSPYLGESAPPPIAVKPKPSPSAPPQAAPDRSNEAPASLPPATTPATAAAPAVVPPLQTEAKPVPPLDPMFSEGQKVTVTVDETAPGGSIPLFADSSSRQPGAIVRPGMSLTIMDGDLQPGGWMYFVRTDEGVKGWVSEKRLRLKF